MFDRLSDLISSGELEEVVTIGTADTTNEIVTSGMINEITASAQDAHAQVADEPPTSEAEAKSCPRCGGELILRTAKREPHAGNEFYGCSNFPKCRYTEEA